MASARHPLPGVTAPTVPDSKRGKRCGRAAPTPTLLLGGLRPSAVETPAPVRGLGQ